jgi:hypothetical protein
VFLGPAKLVILILFVDIPDIAVATSIRELCGPRARLSSPTRWLGIISFSITGIGIPVGHHKRTKRFVFIGLLSPSFFVAASLSLRV